ncbi:MAG TPA: aspartate kinase, partial [Bacteroidales bacterium]|nr:aspartate kinase [Bacteroidales bacterium]
EEILKDAYAKDTVKLKSGLERLKTFHNQIVKEIFNIPKASSVLEQLNELFALLEQNLIKIQLPYVQNYDATVRFGELLSTTILNAYLTENEFNVELLPADKYIITDKRFRSAGIVWPETMARIKALDITNTNNKIFLTQGFIGATVDGIPTTLGREGSDFTAAVFAACLNAKEVWIWKDVPGLLNADPKRFSNTSKIAKISYSEAIELAYYGATIIHPKTIKPLRNSGIKLFVKSFVDPDLPASLIEDLHQAGQNVPSFIVKEQQCLISISARDYSFMDEQLLHKLLGVINQLQIHVNLIQISALSLSFCFDEDQEKLSQLLNALEKDFNVRYNEKLSLFTVRHYNSKIADLLNQHHQVLLEQRSRTTLQLVVPKLHYQLIDSWIKKP